MKKSLVLCSLAALGLTAASAQTSLTIGLASSANCYQMIDAAGNWPLIMTNSFTFSCVAGNGPTGTGYLISSVVGVIYTDPFGNRSERLRYSYSLDLSQVSAPAGHCVTLQIPFGPDLTCTYDVLLAADGNVPVNVATRVAGADENILFYFGTGGQCLSPGSVSTAFSLVSPMTRTATNNVQVFDSYTVSGTNYLCEASVAALVPLIAVITPGAGIAGSGCTNCLPPPLLEFTIQGVLQTNYLTCLSPQPLPPGRVQVMFTPMAGPSNSFVIGQPIVQTLDIGSGGIFTACVPLQTAFQADTWLSVAVRPNGSTNSYTQITPYLHVKETPRAYYAEGAGSVAALNPGQAVTAFNGRTDNIFLRTGANLFLTQSNNTFTMSAGVSDRGMKTDVEPVKPADILAKVAALPIQSWRYTNETAGIRHVGPMAQDFKATFQLGDDERCIGLLDEGGVALVAIQELNQRMEMLSAELKRRDAQNAELKSELSELKQLLQMPATTPAK